MKPKPTRLVSQLLRKTAEQKCNRTYMRKYNGRRSGDTMRSRWQCRGRELKALHGGDVRRHQRSTLTYNMMWRRTWQHRRCSTQHRDWEVTLSSKLRSCAAQFQHNGSGSGTCVTKNYCGYCPNIFLYLYQFWSIYLNICINCIIFTSKTPQILTVQFRLLRKSRIFRKKTSQIKWYLIKYNS